MAITVFGAKSSVHTALTGNHATLKLGSVREAVPQDIRGTPVTKVGNSVLLRR